MKKNASDGTVTEEWDTCFASTIYEKEHKKINYQNFISVTNYHKHN